MAQRRRKLKYIGDELVNANIWDFDPEVAYYQQSWANKEIEHWLQDFCRWKNHKCGTCGCNLDRFTCALTRDRRKAVTICADCFDPTLHVICLPWGTKTWDD